MGRVTTTVLFTDIVGSTELRARLGEEAADDLRRHHDRCLGETVEAHGGRVVKGLGDGILATFPGAADGVGAAAAIQQAIDRLNRSGKAPLPLSIRVGVSVGDVAFEEDDVHGTPVIEASRLCAAADGGEILVSDLARLLAGAGEFDFESRGALTLKGLAGPVTAWELRWEPVGPSTIPMPPLLTEVGRVFVGRNAELARLDQLWKEAAAGERRVALLAGEPGVGKTRLAAELAWRVHAEGATVLAGRCDEDLGVPYQPFVEALRQFVDDAAEWRSELGRYGGELARLVPELSQWAPELPAPLQSDPETERYRLFDAVAAWLASVSADQPLLLVLDDLQWGAKPTLLLLRHVVRSASVRRLLIVGTYRDTELTHDHPLLATVADLRRELGVERLSLSGLDDTGVAAIVEEMAGRTLDEDGVRLAHAIHEETEGNPFFVREVLRHLAEVGAVERQEQGWATRVAVDQIGIPEGVRDVIGRRLSRLSAATNDALRAAAVVGSEFDVPLVQRVSGFDEDALVAALEEAAAARVVSESSATRYRFAHALVRTALYESLSAPRRVALHRKVAEAIEGLHEGALDDYLPALAHHWARASAPAADVARAVDYATRAGDRALVQLAYDEAVAYYRQAVELLPDTDHQRPRCELFIALGEAQRRAGDPGYRQTLLEAADLARQLGDADALARAAVANNRGFFSVVEKVDAERVAVLETALDAMGSGDSPLRARVLAILASELTYSPDHERRHRLAAEALGVAERLGDPRTLGTVLALRATTVWAPTTVEDRFRRTEELAVLAVELGDPTLAFWANCYHFIAAVEKGDMATAEQSLRRAGEAVDEVGQPFLQWPARYIATCTALLAGRPDEAEVLAQRAYEAGQAVGAPDAFLFYGTQMFWVRFDQGRLEEVLPMTERAARRPGASPLTRASLALALCELDRHDEARRLLPELAGVFDDAPLHFQSFVGLNVLGAVVAAVGEQGPAAALYEKLAPFSDVIPTTSLYATGSVHYVLGGLAGALSRFDAADRHLAAAEAGNQTIGAAGWLARTRLEWARMLRQRGEPGDAGRARELLVQASTAAGQLGLRIVHRRAVALLDGSA